MNDLIDLLTYIALVSVSAERATDLVKRSILVRFNPPGYVYQLISFSVGVLFAFAETPKVWSIDNTYVIAIMVGLAASGGASMWNDLLQITSQFKTNLRKGS